jgi:hypothetical protein
MKKKNNGSVVCIFKYSAEEPHPVDASPAPGRQNDAALDQTSILWRIQSKSKQFIHFDAAPAPHHCFTYVIRYRYVYSIKVG